MEALPKDLSKAIVVDVRNPWEFQAGHVDSSVNIPLNEIPARINEFMSFNRPVILCCASGNRSGQATMYLRQQGVADVYNGGSWLDVNGLMSN